MALIEFKNLKKRFGKLVVLDGASFSVAAGESVVVLGASGTGKSVLLKHLVGLLRPDAGEVWFAGQQIDTMTDRELMVIRQRMGFLFQQGALFDSMSVADNIAFPIRQHSRKTETEVAALVKEKLAMVGLPDLGGKMPGELSGGQKKRVALARAIALSPEVIVYDEPTTGLDPIRSDVINQLILKLKRELNITSLIVTHDMVSAFKIGDRLIMLSEGKVVAEGTVDDYRTSTDPVVRRFVDGVASEAELAGLR